MGVRLTVHHLALLVASFSSCMRAADRHASEAPPHPSRGAVHESVATAMPVAVAAGPVFAGPAPRAELAAGDEIAIDGEEPIEIVDVALATVQLDHFTEVRAAPDATSPLLGVLAIGSRVEVHPPIATEDCTHGWRAIEPRGYVCADVRATDKAPSTEMFPRVSPRALVPGVYGKVRAEGAQIFADAEAARRGVGGRTPDAALTVRRLGTERVGGRTYWRTRHGLVDAKHIRQLDQSRFHGVEIDDELATPIAFARFRGDDGTIAVREAADIDAKITARMKAKAHARVLEISADGRWARLDSGGWAATDELRIASRTATPEGIASDERWLDIDLEQQTLVAYVGPRAVFATLVSTGRVGHETPTGIFRIERKVAERTMSSRPGDDEPYAVDRVPWTAYFIGSFALHTAYWHGSFGERKSHGCVNLAPKDARRLYAWTAPGVGPGYVEIHGSAAQPGAVVQIRSKQDPTPSWQGYAAEMVARR
jgi:hypothetical protein